MMRIKTRVSLIYLLLIPVLTAVLGFAVGHISYKIYLPVWILNVCLMLTCTWLIGGNMIWKPDANSKQLAATGFLFIVPWLFISMFFGLGPPPQTVSGWVETATEQKIRYAFLVISGIFVATAFTALREKLKNLGENIYSLIGYSFICIAIPLFILNMLFWGTYLTEYFSIVNGSISEKKPDWFLPVRNLFNSVSVVEVSLIYLATAAFAVSMKKTGIFKPLSCRIYILFSFLGFLLDALADYLPEPVAFIGFLASIPAVPLIMPYLIGVHLLRRSTLAIL